MKGSDRLFRDGVKAHQEGRLADAQLLYERALALNPRHPDLLHFFGVLRHNQKQSAAGLDMIERSLKLAPGNAHAWLNFGNILLECEQTERAEAAYKRASVLAPGLPDAWFNLGFCLRKMQDAPGAVAALTRALKLNPRHAPSLYQRGIAAREAGDPASAERDFRAALEVSPGYVEIYESLGALLYRQGRYADAEPVYRAWLDHEPDSATAQHLHAAVSGHQTPDRASDQYITDTFNRFAATFEANLAGLGYRAPQLVCAAIHAAAPDRGKLRHVLDAGCGTGLCGPLLRPAAQHLTGVDLSPAMIDAARAKHCYEELHVGELCSFMADRPASFDAVVAADTFNYFGAIGPVLHACAACLKTGGVLAFTLEKRIGDALQDFRIEPHGRYTHRLDYIRTSLEQAGLEVLDVQEQVLRRERGADAVGYVVSARLASTRASMQ